MNEWDKLTIIHIQHFTSQVYIYSSLFAYQCGPVWCARWSVLACPAQARQWKWAESSGLRCTLVNNYIVKMWQIFAALHNGQTQATSVRSGQSSIKFQSIKLKSIFVDISVLRIKILEEITKTRLAICGFTPHDKCLASKEQLKSRYREG